LTRRGLFPVWSEKLVMPYEVAMNDCKKHYSDMYQTRMGEAECPWCRIEELEHQGKIADKQLAYVQLVNTANIELLEDLKDLISDSAPLCWANSGDTKAAYEWEQRAEKLLA
jgi:hypothetical protein